MGKVIKVEVDVTLPNLYIIGQVCHISKKKKKTRDINEMNMYLQPGLVVGTVHTDSLCLLFHPQASGEEAIWHFQ